jgi:ribosomal protein L24E
MAFYFEVFGEAACWIDRYDSAIGKWDPKSDIHFATAAFEKRKGHIKPDGAFTNEPVRLRFIGNYDYSVRSVALFDKVYSSDEEKSPELSEYVRYDLNVMCHGFIGLADNPLLPGYERLTGKYFLEDGGVLLVPREYCEDLKIKYKRAPARLVWKEAPTEDDTEIELDAELSELVPILMAAYIWADEGDGKYAFYLELYRERAAEIERRQKSRAPAEYKITGGW